jgi:hypothetical protein
MLTFKSFLNTVDVYLLEREQLVHKSAPAQPGAWTLRNPTAHGSRPSVVATFDTIVLKDAKPYFDSEAQERGDKVVAYIKGERTTTDVPAASGAGGRAVGYYKDHLPAPFRYTDDKSEYKGSSFAVFDGNSFKAY